MMIGERIDDFAETLAADKEIETILEGALEAEREEVWPKDENGAVRELPETALNLAFLATMIAGFSDDPHYTTLDANRKDGASLKDFYGDFTEAECRQTNTALGYRADLPSTGFILHSRQPDLMGEWQILSGLAKAGRAERKMRIKRLIYDAFCLEPSNLTAFLFRLAEDFPNHEITTALFQAPLPRMENADAERDIFYQIDWYLLILGWPRWCSTLSKTGSLQMQCIIETGTFPLLMAAQ